MRQTARIFYFLIFIFFYNQISSGQVTIPATGGSATGTGGSASYTVGQVIYNQFNGSTGFIIQGVQQPYEISIVTAIENTEDITLDCIVYPNPTEGNLKLVIGSFEEDNMSFRLFNINGILIQDLKIEDIETTISMDNLTSGIYFLKIVKNNIQLKVFKIVKK
jgi:hypothetical protein